MNHNTPENRRAQEAERWSDRILVIKSLLDYRTSWPATTTQRTNVLIVTVPNLLVPTPDNPINRSSQLLRAGT